MVCNLFWLGHYALIFKGTRRDEYVDDILCHDIYFLILADTFNMYFKDTHSQTRSKRNRITLFTMCKFFLVMNISEYCYSDVKQQSTNQSINCHKNVRTIPTSGDEYFIWQWFQTFVMNCICSFLWLQISSIHISNKPYQYRRTDWWYQWGLVVHQQVYRPSGIRYSHNIKRSQFETMK